MGRLRALIVTTAVVATGLGLVPLVPVTTAPVGAVVNPTPTIDPMNRASVLAAYQSSLVEARTVPVGWTGSVDGCVKGTESAASIQATQAGFNFYRGLVGLPAVTMNATKNSEAMAAALIMQARGSVTHFPEPSDPCYTAEGDTAAGASNLSPVWVGARAIDSYMADLGPGNFFAGHRRTMFYPSTTNIGTGSTSGFNALRVYGGEAASRPAGVSWIRWPNAGFVPKRALRPFNYGTTVLFSLSNSQIPDADYNSASVTVKVGATNLAVTVHDEVENYGDDTLTFDVTIPSDYDSSDADVKFDIAVSGMKTAGGAAIPNQSWSSTAIVNASAATAPGAPTGVTATAGNAQANVSWTAPASNGGSAITGYKVTPYIGANAQTVRSFSGTGTTRTVTGLTNGTAYTFKVQAVNAIGTGALSSASGAVTPTASAAPYAPYSSWTHLVDQVYRQLIGRLPTSNERSQWVNTLQTGTTSPGDLVANLRQSSHHRTIVDQVTRLYRAYYLRSPDKGGLEYWIAQRLGGRSMVSISDFFSRSAEFVEIYGTLSNAQFVALVYQNVLDRPGSVADRNYWTAEISSGRRTRGTVMIGFSESAEYKSTQSSEVTVSVLYILWVDRVPTSQELTNGVAALDGGMSVSDYADTLLPKAHII